MFYLLVRLVTWCLVCLPLPVFSTCFALLLSAPLSPMNATHDRGLALQTHFRLTNVVPDHDTPIGVFENAPKSLAY